jgi:hypothetical protein
MWYNTFYRLSSEKTGKRGSLPDAGYFRPSARNLCYGNQGVKAYDI